MKLKKILSVILSGVMLLSCLGLTAFAELPDGAATTGGYVLVNGGSTQYASLTEAAAAANSAAENVYTVYGKVEYVTGTDLANGAPSVKIVNGENGEVTLTTNYHLGLAAAGATLNIAGITINDRSDITNAESALTAWEWRYIQFDGATSVIAEEVTFTEGVITGNEAVTFKNCDFIITEESAYSVWVGAEGAVVIDGCSFASPRGIKAFADYADEEDVIDLTVTNCEFTKLYKKPAIVFSSESGGKIVSSGNEITGESTEKAMYVVEAEVTLETTDAAAYVINDEGFKQYYTTVEAAEEALANNEAFDADTGITVAAASIGAVKYFTLQEALAAAIGGDTVEILTDITFTEPWNQIWDKTNLTINGNNHTLTFEQPNYSNGNGDEILYGAVNLNVKDLVIKFAEGDSASSGFSVSGGSFENVDFYNGKYAIMNRGAVSITNCNFYNQAWIAIYSDDGGNTNGTTITNCTFTDTRAYIARSDEVIHGNEIVLDEKTELNHSALTIAPGASAYLTYNIIPEGTDFEIYDSPSRITKNFILGTVSGDSVLSDVAVTISKLSSEALEALNSAGLSVVSVAPSAIVRGKELFDVDDAALIAEEGATITLTGDSTATAAGVALITEKSLVLDIGSYALTVSSHGEVAALIDVPEGYSLQSHEADDGLSVTYTVEEKNTRRRSTGGGASASTCIVRFDTNGAGEIAAQSVKKGGVVIAPEAPEKEGFAFGGWYTDKNFVNEYDFESKVTKAFTLYAKWTEIDEMTKRQIVLTIGKTEASVFGKIIENDVAPKIVNERTMLPARFVAENLGAAVTWDADKRAVTIKKDETVIIITIDSDVALVNGEEIELDAPAFIENDRTYTPIRFISENLGATVAWDAETRTVTITK